jgi:hypothetical protein
MISDSVEYFACIPCLKNRRFANTLPHIGAMRNVLLGIEIKPNEPSENLAPMVIVKQWFDQAIRVVEFAIE